MERTIVDVPRTCQVFIWFDHLASHGAGRLLPAKRGMLWSRMAGSNGQTSAHSFVDIGSAPMINCVSASTCHPLSSDLAGRHNPESMHPARVALPAQGCVPPVLRS